jgi:hypothetical protein
MNPDPLPFSRPLRGFYPLTINANTVPGAAYQYLNPLDQGLPPVIGPDLSTGIIPVPKNADERSPGTSLTRGYIQSWNFSIERRLPFDMSLTTAYVGTQTTHQMAYLDINAAAPGAGAAGRPYAKLNGRTVATYLFDGFLSSNYHALQVSLDKRFSKGLLVKGAYTWSKAMDMTDDDGWATLKWNWGPVFNRNYAPAGYDRTHIFQMAWVYELPFGHGKQWASSGPAAWVIGNWQVNGHIAAYTGTPFSVSSPGGSLNAPGNDQQADQVKTNVERIGQVGPGTYYFDPKAFAAVTDPNRFGTSGRNILRNPGLFNTDLSLFRDVRIGERAKLSFRAEAYNLPNTSHFNGPSSTDVTNGNFMRILTSYGERQIRFGLRLGF